MTKTDRSNEKFFEKSDILEMISRKTKLPYELKSKIDEYLLNN